MVHWRRMSRKSCLLLTACAVLLAASAPAVAANDEAGTTAALLKSLDLSLTRDESGGAVRVPLGAGARAGLAGWLPYVSLGARTPEAGREPARGDLAAPPALGEAAAPAVDVGLGVNWKLLQRMELFGEYRILHVSPTAERPDGAGPGRPADGPALKGGFTIRFN